MGIETWGRGQEDEGSLGSSHHREGPIGETSEFNDVFEELGNVNRQALHDAAMVDAIQGGGTGRAELRPDFEQDGGNEIHPLLKGVTFKFWGTPSNSPKGMRMAVNYSGDAPQAPWAHQLTGKVFRNFSDAKGWLREEAKRLAGEKK